jgi:GTPase SAR1 family protein
VESQISEEIIQQAKELWGDDVVKEIWEMRDSLPNFTIVNFDYILKNIERLSQNDAVVNNDDIVRCRQRTTGLSEIEFPYDKNYFQMFDVGGQKPERRKWYVIAQTHKPTALLFFTSLVDFDVPLLVEQDKTRMDESLEVWDEILNREEFDNTTIVLLFNKNDLFEDKIERVDMKASFKKYKGGHDIEKAREYIRERFLATAEKSRHTKNKIYSYFTCAIDTNLMKTIFEGVSEQILKDRLQGIINI